MASLSIVQGNCGPGHDGPATSEPSGPSAGQIAAEQAAIDQKNSDFLSDPLDEAEVEKILWEDPVTESNPIPESSLVITSPKPTEERIWKPGKSDMEVTMRNFLANKNPAEATTALTPFLGSSNPTVQSLALIGIKQCYKDNPQEPKQALSDILNTFKTHIDWYNFLQFETLMGIIEEDDEEEELD